MRDAAKPQGDARRTAFEVIQAETGLRAEILARLVIALQIDDAGSDTVRFAVAALAFS